MKTKVCTGCKQEKTIDQFNKEKKNKDGLCIYCKECSKEMNKKWREGHKERQSEISKNCYERNKEKVLSKQKEKYHEDPNKFHNRRKEYRKNNPLRHTLVNCVSRAKQNNMPYDSSKCLFDYLKPIFDKGVCECCGKELEITVEKGIGVKDNSFSIDRIDSNKGYTVDNVAILCLRCNKIKNNAIWQELLIIGNWVKERELNLSKNNQMLVKQNSHDIVINL